jgi:hypothetical protein
LLGHTGFSGVMEPFHTMKEGLSPTLKAKG